MSQWKSKLRFKLCTWRSKQLLSQYDLRLLWFQTIKVRGEMEDRRQREKEKQVSPVYPWDHMCRAARETEEQPHKLLPLQETPTGRNKQSMRVNKPFSYQEIQRIKEDLGDYLEDPEKYIRAFKGVTLLYDLTRKDVMYIFGQTLTPDSKT